MRLIMIKKTKTIFLSLNLFIPSVVFAEEAESAVMEPLSVGSMIQVFSGLVAVLLLFGGIVYVLKRIGGFRPSQGGNMRVIDGVSVSARDRLLLIEVGEKQVLVGVSANGISPITVFDEPVVSVPEKAEYGFAGQLQKQLKTRLNPDQNNKTDPS